MNIRTILLLVSVALSSLSVAQTDAPSSEEWGHDFGTVFQDSENRHVFMIKNTGDLPLVIESATGSCGCTVPEYAQEPIMPGAESEVVVIYKPGKQEGDQQKTVTIIANTDPKETVLRIKAHVLAEGATVETKHDRSVGTLNDAFVDLWSMVALAAQPDEEADMDDLLPDGDVAANGPTTTLQFDVTKHDFGQVFQGSENPYVFKFKNVGDAPLIISQASGSCGCTVPFYAKDPIMPGEESEIHVVYKPGKQQGNQSKSVTITANTTPVQTVLRITAEVLVVDSVIAPSLFVLEEERLQERAAIAAVDPGCFVIFPNPASNELRLDLKEHIGGTAEVRIHDETGRTMLETRIAPISSEASRLDIASFPPGIYVATIQLEGGQPMAQCFVVSE
ncbi:MAG: DUF1573 domain-containing protein [Flavobacteriales bacterium]|nr:DUF1573 domain-containing protein [Flavobacteriales bacterium]